MPLHYDNRHMEISSAERRALQNDLRAAHERLEATREAREQGFFDLPFDTKGAALVRRAAKRVRERFSRLIVVGIGGSDLGARAIWRALGNEDGRLTFLSNPDPETISKTMRSVDWARTAIAAVSKSGTTLETMAAFMVLRQELIKSVGQKRHAAHVVAITDPSPSSVLYQIAGEEGYEVVPHPTNVGGRFSVLSAVGLFPAAVGGISVARLLVGAREVEDERRQNGANSLPAQYAADQYLSLARRRRHIHVLMPYADSLSDLCYWYRQLWAESLGKRRDGEPVGPTPVAAFGAIDQHSQIQLYNDGPDDKTVTFLEVERFRASVRVPNVWKDRQGIGHIGGQSLETILHAERSGTEHALARKGRACGTIRIPSVSPESMGALFMFFEAATAYMGQLMGIDAYDQPGVEEGKKETRRILEVS
jgi:glucose-6-phosphate isomerase